MTTRELAVINSVCKNKDVQTLMTPHADEMMLGYGEVWLELKDYYGKYHSIPDIEVMQEKFPGLDTVDVKGEAQYYMNDLREEIITARVQAVLMKAKDAFVKGETGPRVLSKLQTSINKLGRFSSTTKDVNLMDFDSAERHYEEVRKQAALMGGMPGIGTGISFIDSAYPSGLAGGDLVIVLGWTGRAKSLFTALLACNSYRNGFKPMIASLEMGEHKMRDRVYTIMGSGLFTNTGLALGDVDPDNFRTFKSQYEDKGDFIFVENDSIGELTPNVMQAKVDQHRPSMIIVDYAQLASDNANSNDMTARMRNMSREYKRLGTANNIPVVLISSATPEGTSSISSPPTIEQVAWSKQLSYDADLAFAVHKHDDLNIIEIVCRKNRNGPLFDGFLDWDIDKGIIKEVFDPAASLN